MTDKNEKISADLNKTSDLVNNNLGELEDLINKLNMSKENLSVGYIKELSKLTRRLEVVGKRLEGM